MRSDEQLLDGLAELPPGPELAAALAGLDPLSVPNDRMVDILQARARQLAHDQSQLFAALYETARRAPGVVADVRRRAAPYEWASGEIAAALTWTTASADRELSLAEQLIDQLPAVFAALARGEIDRAKAWVFAQHLTSDVVTEGQIEVLCSRYVPLAREWTARQLAARLLRAILAIDPDYARRRYERAVRERAVHHWLDPTGTVTVSATGLAADEASAACARLDRLAASVRRAGHPWPLPSIAADIYVGMLGGRYTGMTEADIIADLLGAARSDKHPSDPAAGSDGSSDVSDPAAGSDDSSDASDPAVGSGELSDTSGSAAGLSDPVDDSCAPATAERSAGVHGGSSAAAAEPEGDAARPATGPPAAAWPRAGTPSGRPVPDQPSPGTGPWREGVEIRIGLATLLGLDRRPGEIPGLGAVLPGIARRIVTAQHRGAEWRFAVVDEQGYLILAGVTRRRPRLPRDMQPGRVRGGIVELQVTEAELVRLDSPPAESAAATSAWADLVADLAGQFARRDEILAGLDSRPRSRFAHAALARHIQVRDRTCAHIGCLRPARACDLDHTRDHARGGATTRAGIGPGCRRHHRDKHVRHWRLEQPEPGLFVWTSPLGRTYRTRGESIIPPLPDPVPRADPTDPTDTPGTSDPADLPILWRGPPPSVEPEPAPVSDDVDEPPF